MYGYIYITTDMLTGKKYIGKHKAAEFEFEKYQGSGKIIQSILKKDPSRLKTELLPSINNVNTVYESLEELNNSEFYYINYYNCIESSDYYNLIPGGIGIDYSYLDEETKYQRGRKISTANKERWANTTSEDIEDRSNKWRETYFNKSDEEIAERNKRNSDAHKERYKNLSEEEKELNKLKLKKAHQKLLSDPEREAERKRKEKLAKNDHTEEQKLEYRYKQQLAHKGQKYFTNGVVSIKCFPGEEPEGFYLGGAHRNNYRFIIYIDDMEFLGASLAADYLKANSYSKINYERVLKIAREGNTYKGKYSELKGRIILNECK